MIKKKICMLGSFGVGKTSLTSRFVMSQYDERYHTTVGVKTDKKVLQCSGKDVTLMLWDMAGEEDNLPIKLNYVRDASGYILVIDGTRASTFDVALSIQDRVRTNVADLPFVVAVNKADQRETWEVPEARVDGLRVSGWTFFETSAKTGLNVEKAFMTLTELMLNTGNKGAHDSVTELA